MNNYKSLSSIVKGREIDLRIRLRKMKTPSDLPKAHQFCTDFLKEVTSVDTEYMNQLTLRERELLIPVLQITYLSAPNFLDSDTNSTIAPPQQKPVSRANNSQSTIQRFISECKGFVRNTNKCKESSAFVSETPFTSDVINSIIKHLVSVADYVDQTLLTYRNHLHILQQDKLDEIASYSLDRRYSDVLECLQISLGNLQSMEQTEIVEDTVKYTNRLLSCHGYKYIHYSEEARDLFDVRIDDTCSAPDEFFPAIVKIDEGREVLVLKGKVVLSK